MLAFSDYNKYLEYRLKKKMGLFWLTVSMVPVGPVTFSLGKSSHGKQYVVERVAHLRYPGRKEKRRKDQSLLISFQDMPSMDRDPPLVLTS